MALVDSGSFYIEGYFEETAARIHEGDPVTVTLMGDDRRIHGHVESIALGIADRDRSTGANLLPNVNPTFNWVRLAQRIPVRVKIDQVPEGVRLVARPPPCPSTRQRRGRTARRATPDPRSPALRLHVLPQPSHEYPPFPSADADRRAGGCAAVVRTTGRPPMPPSSDRTRRRPSWSRMRRPTGRRAARTLVAAATTRRWTDWWNRRWPPSDLRVAAAT